MSAKMNLALGAAVLFFAASPPVVAAQVTAEPVAPEQSEIDESYNAAFAEYAQFAEIEEYTEPTILVPDYIVDQVVVTTDESSNQGACSPITNSDPSAFLSIDSEIPY